MWLVPSLVGSVVGANQAELNRIYQQCGYRLTLWRTVMMAVIWAPLVLVGHWPHDPLFYAAATFSGVGMLVGSTITSNLAASHNGRVAVLHMPLKALVVFLAWLVINEPARDRILERPDRLPLVLLSLAVMAGALFTFRRNDASWGTLRQVLPVVALYSCNDICTRLVMPAAELKDKLVLFLFIMVSVCALCGALVWPWRPRRKLPLATRPLLEAAGLGAVGGVVNQMCFFSALAMAPNPAYASMLMLLTPVWLLMWHRWKGIKDDASPVAGTVLVVAAIVLMIAVA